MVHYSTSNEDEQRVTISVKQEAHRIETPTPALSRQPITSIEQHILQRGEEEVSQIRSGPEPRAQISSRAINRKGKKGISKIHKKTPKKLPPHTQGEGDKKDGSWIEDTIK
jgi:hypothetical protein